MEIEFEELPTRIKRELYAMLPEFLFAPLSFDDYSVGEAVALIRSAFDEGARVFEQEGLLGFRHWAEVARETDNLRRYEAWSATDLAAPDYMICAACFYTDRKTGLISKDYYEGNIKPPEALSFGFGPFRPPIPTEEAFAFLKYCVEVEDYDQSTRRYDALREKYIRVPGFHHNLAFRGDIEARASGILRASQDGEASYWSEEEGQSRKEVEEFGRAMVEASQAWVQSVKAEIAKAAEKDEGDSDQLWLWQYRLVKRFTSSAEVDAFMDLVDEELGVPPDPELAEGTTIHWIPSVRWRVAQYMNAYDFTPPRPFDWPIYIEEGLTMFDGLLGRTPEEEAKLIAERLTDLRADGRLAYRVQRVSKSGPGLPVSLRKAVAEEMGVSTTTAGEYLTRSGFQLPRDLRFVLKRR